MQENEQQQQQQQQEQAATVLLLSSLQRRNLIFSFCAWACTVCNVTLVVGTSAVVMQNIGGTATTAPLGAFLSGSAVVSLLLTPWLFDTKFQRTGGFIVGIVLGFMGTLLGILAVVSQSPALLVVASVCFGMANGIGFFWRFAAVEVVPKAWASKAVALVVSGGCLAAFCGPESARVTQGKFGDDEDYEFLGVFVMTGIFNLANLFFTLLVQFPTKEKTAPTTGVVTEVENQTTPTTTTTTTITTEASSVTLRSLLTSRGFIVPMILSGLTWILMALPMSLVRVAMHQTGFTQRQSLLTVELHFLAMYGPGFVTGKLIQKFGYKQVCASGSLLFILAGLCTILLSKENDGRAVTLIPWIVGQLLVGAGWNLGFTGATVWTTLLYKDSPMHKSKVQAANDCLMFLLSGAWTVSASYIFEAGGSGLDGWRVLNLVVLGFLALFVVLVGADRLTERRTTSN